MPPGDLEELTRQMERLSPQQILAWGWREFGARAVLSSSFQTQSAALLHMLSLTCPEMPLRSLSFASFGELDFC